MRRSIGGGLGRPGVWLSLGLLALGCDTEGGGGSGSDKFDADPGNGEDQVDGGDSSVEGLDGNVRDARVDPDPDQNVPPGDVGPTVDEGVTADANGMPDVAEGDARPKLDGFVPLADAGVPCEDGESRDCPEAACPGSTQSCVDGVFEECGPPAELCNGADDDCNGTIDDGFDLAADCEAGVGDCVSTGLTVCAADGLGVVCGAAPGAPRPEACNGLDDDCDSVIDGGPDGAFSEPCYTGPEGTEGEGACAAGVSICADGIAGACSGETLPGVETCNGVDDDCDGQVDESEGGAPLTGACYTGPPGTEVNGLCRPGVQVCGVGGVFGPCEGEVVPAFEICDQADNDCNGASDEVAGGCACEPGEVQGCYSGLPGTENVGRCAGGQQTCLPDGTSFGPCLGETLPLNEVCDGVDNDCNSEIDDAIAGARANCSAGVGACSAPGLTFCDPALAEVVCGAAPLPPQPELCDGIDNDCNGTADDGLPIGDPCSLGVGACAVSGTFICDAFGGVVCDGPIVPPSNEVCDGQDNDCDGENDNDLGLGEGCILGLGACEARGVRVCDANGGVACDAREGNPAPEVCNGVDDNCDGDVDDGNPGGGDACNFEAPGICAAGVTECSEGSVSCAPSVVPEVETCDGTDEDCDDVIDNGEGGEVLSQVCYSGPAGTAGVGICHGGISSCAGGAFGACAGETVPGVEICDSADNDCNGIVDDVAAGRCECSPGARRGCYSGQPNTENVGLCHAGTQVCAANGLSFGACEGEIVPAGERCDGLDNNCNGRVDDAIPGVGAACNSGVGDCNARGVTFCDADTGDITCGAQPGDPRAEICDGRDNNCDGAVDDGLNLGNACSAGVGACTAQGTLVCGGNGGVTCSAVPRNPGAEICDNVDNDCDGIIDDGLNLGSACSVGVGGCRRSGVLTCGAGGAVVCSVGAGAPVAELCDGVDNDCDGLTDEGNPGGGANCDTGLPGVCSSGFVACRNFAFFCVQRTAASAETCDSLDNDCDGNTDEDASGGALTRTCYEGPAGTNNVGICHGGFATCGAGRFGACVGQVVPGNEICDASDNNCDGTVDNPPGGAVCACLPGMVRNCYTGPDGTQNVGACRGGTQTCNAQGSGFGACNNEVRPSGETCDGADNDCNAAVDDAAGVGQACNVGNGQCARSGHQICNAQTGNLVCDVQPGAAAPEVCNGLDDDCDTVVDDVDGLGAACSNGLGECSRAGNRICDLAQQALRCDAVPAPAGVEVCDGLDNNCNGQPDDGQLAGVGIDCQAGVGACQAGGVTICSGAAGVTCGAQPGAAAPETCDGVDNDCDGAVDDSAQGTGVACNAGVGACNRPGTIQCANAQLGCNAVPGQPVAESCDALDNDCDGNVDDGLNCNIYTSCLDAYSKGQDTNGIYRLRPTGAGNPFNIYCDMQTDSGGWSLVASTVGATLNDDGSGYYADLTTLAPALGHTTIWDGMRTLSERFDLRFACRDAVRAADAPMTVDISFYRTPWYRELVSGADANSCFNEADGAGQDMAPIARRDNLTGTDAFRGDQWNFGYFEGEDACGDAGDFTVDFDDRGMGNNRNDGTDWGEDDNLRKCGRSGLATGQWFMFARERRRVGVLGPALLANLQAAGLPAEALSYQDEGVDLQVDTRTYETLVLGRYAQDWSLMTQGLSAAIAQFAYDGGNIVTEYDGASILASGYDGSFVFANGAADPIGLFPGVIGGGSGPGANTPVTPAVLSDPLFSGVVAPIQGGAGTSDFLYAHPDDGEDTYLRTLATFPGDGEIFPGGPLPAIIRGRYCGGNVVMGNFNYADNLQNASIAALVANLGRDSILAPFPADEDPCPLPLRPDVLLCGGSLRDVNEFIRGGSFLNVFAGCDPDDFTQAILITHGAVGDGTAFDPATLRAYVRNGGVVLTEFGSSDEVFNAVFGTNVPPGAQIGDCRNAVAPLVQFTTTDAFWDENRHSPPVANRRGCGFDLQGYPGITRLGGPNGQSITLGYRDADLGRVWLVEADWADNRVNDDASMNPTRGMMHYMITHAPNPFDFGRLPNEAAAPQ